MRSLRTILLLAVAAALAAGLAACGSSSSSSSSGTAATSGGSLPAGVQTPATESLTGGKKGGVLNEVQSRGLRTPRPRSGVLPARLPDHGRHAALAVLLQAEHVHRSDTGHGRRRAEDLRRQQADHDQHPQRRSLQSAGQPRSDGGGRGLRDRSRRQPERRQPLLPGLPRIGRRPEGRRKAARFPA